MTLKIRNNTDEERKAAIQEYLNEKLSQSEPTAFANFINTVNA